MPRKDRPRDRIVRHRKLLVRFADAQLQDIVSLGEALDQHALATISQRAEGRFHRRSVCLHLDFGGIRPFGEVEGEEDVAAADHVCPLCDDGQIQTLGRRRRCGGCGARAGAGRRIVATAGGGHEGEG